MNKSLVALALAGLLTLTACGSSDEPTSGASDPATTVASSSAEQTTPVKGREVNPETFAEDLRENLRRAGTFTSTTTTAGDTTTETQYDYSDPDAIKTHSITTVNGEVTESLIIGTNVYTKSPGASTWVLRATEGLSAASFSLPEGTTATKIGPETIDGVETTHYQVVNPDLGVTMDYYLTDDGLPRRVSTGSGTLDFDKFGEPVDIVEPDPSEVTQG